MAVNDVYALNTVSGVVEKIRPELLSHPTIGANLIQVETPDACIACGDQPDSVVTTDGEVIDLTEDDFEDYPEEETD